MSIRYIIARPYQHNVWFYEGRNYMANELHKGVRFYVKHENAKKTLKRLHTYDGAWIIVSVSI